MRQSEVSEEVLTLIEARLRKDKRALFLVRDAQDMRVQLHAMKELLEAMRFNYTTRGSDEICVKHWRTAKLMTVDSVLHNRLAGYTFDRWFMQYAHLVVWLIQE